MPAQAAAKKKSSATKAKKVTKVAKKKMDFSMPVMGMLQTKVSKRPGPGGTALWTTLIYSARGALTTPTLGVGTGYKFNASSVFDPDFTGVGAQPVGFDQLSPLYEKYVVWKTEYKVVFSNQNPSLDDVVGVHISDIDPSIIDHERFIQNGMTEWNVAERSGAGNSRVTFVGTIDLPKLNGMSRAAYLADDVHQASVTGDPTDACFLTLFGAHLDGGASGTGLVRWEIELRYHVKFFGTGFTTTS